MVNRSFLAVMLVLFSMMGKSFAGPQEDFTEQMKQIGIDCNKFTECWNQLSADNPGSPEIEVIIAPSMGGIQIAKTIRDRFKDKVSIWLLGAKKFEAESRRPFTTFSITSNISPSSSFRPGVQSKLVLTAHVITATLDKDFNGEALSENIRKAENEVGTQLGELIANWIENEIALQKKIQIKNASQSSN